MNNFVVAILERLYKNSLLPGQLIMCNALNEITGFKYKVSYSDASECQKQIYIFNHDTEKITITFNLDSDGYVRKIECI